MDKILIIAAHPDDDILGCGGIISKFKDSDKIIRVIFIAEGSSCRFPVGNISSEDVQAVIQQRNSYGIKALEYLGVNSYSFYNFPCGRLDSIPIIDINKVIEKEIRDFQPDTIFTHSENDTNNDHRIILRSTLMSTRPIPGNCVMSIFSYEILSSSEWNFGGKSFEPNYFFELSEKNVQDKISALNLYESEIRPYPFPRSKEGVEINAQNRGMQVGLKYAEAFKLLRTTIK